MATVNWDLVLYVAGALVTAEIAKRKWGMDGLRQAIVAIGWPVVWPIFIWARITRDV